MPTEIKLPILGENIDSATVARILVKVGDTIAKDQAIMELETEKAAVDLPAPAAGTIKEIQVKQGDTVKVGQIVAIVEEGAEASKEAPKEKKEEKQKEEPKQEEPQQAAQKGAPPEKKQEPEPPAKPEPAPPQREEPAAASPEPPSTGGAVVPAAPALRRIARELGIDIQTVKGTGNEGRITEEDIRHHARSIIINATDPSSPSRWGEVERKPMSAIRRKTAEHVEEAWSTIPHVTQFDSADITELEKTRSTFAKQVEDAGGKLTITAIVLKASAAALKMFPQFNVSVDMAAGEILSKKYIHIGIAVDTEHGLLVPVIRDVDKKSIIELSVELTDLAERARKRKLSVEDMQGGTFTITNLGGIGGSYFTPIVNAPEVAILGISRAVEQPVYTNGHLHPRLMLPLSLSYDHRAIDGVDGARFLRWMKEALEQPFMLSLAA